MLALGQASSDAPAPSAAQKQAKFELGVWLALYNWDALNAAIQHGFSEDNEDPEDKRDWFAGAICELFEEDSNTEIEDVEFRLLQIMEDEFSTRVEDESTELLPGFIMLLWRQTRDGYFKTVDDLQARWESEKGNRETVMAKAKSGSDDESETDEDEDEDVDMDEAPQLVPRQRVEPEVDEDGFTKVLRKKR
ncbi:hypothetical protein EJ06DRAFT_528145 [Trichodelitschia bisporula]|uniref:Pre-rRNA-processing protein TSR2 n=1 Tax=Trichodelitschia bisporula TaxID=703511 RepID=A0A6G1I568_9PEZI|nr:hypothetical protein EJ06DRAFT_528145 [Trichodelitschia bisporula]